MRDLGCCAAAHVSAGDALKHVQRWARSVEKPITDQPYTGNQKSSGCWKTAFLVIQSVAKNLQIAELGHF